MLLYPVYHTHCGTVVFFTAVRWGEGDLMRAEDVYLFDGERPVPGSLVHCPHCGASVWGGLTMGERAEVDFAAKEGPCPF